MADQAHVQDIYAQLHAEHPDWTWVQVSTEALRLTEAAAYIPAPRRPMTPNLPRAAVAPPARGEAPARIDTALAAALLLPLAVVAGLALRKLLKRPS
jgi:hypothetical protein